MQETLIPVVQVRKQMILLYNTPEVIHRRFTKTPAQLKKESQEDEIQQPNKSDLHKSAYSGKMTPGAKKRLRKACDILFQVAPKRKVYNPVRGYYQKFQVGFITLTIHSPERNITAKEASKKVLEPFLLHARRHWGLKLYVWRAELQARGQIHYHVFVDTWIHYQEIRDVWNKYQAAAGYLDQYIAEHGNSNANSTDVKNLNKTRDILEYVLKYMQKDGNPDATTEGKIWDCCRELKKADYFTTEECGSIDEALQAEIEAKRAHIFQGERYICIRIHRGSAISVLPEWVQQQYIQWQKNVYNPPPDPEPGSIKDQLNLTPMAVGVKQEDIAMELF